MGIREAFVAHPVAVVLSAAFALALLATVVVAATTTGVVLTLRLAALTVVLFLFAAGFWAGPVGERYL